MLPLAGLDSLTGGGAFSGSSAASATGGDVSLGGISFGSSGVNVTLIAALAAAAVLVVFLARSK